MSFPRYLRFIVTNACNINCIMCELRDVPEKFTLSSLWLARELDRFLPYAEDLFWQGGEVFMVPHFREMIERAAAFSDLEQTVQTNGLFLTEEWVEILTRHPVSIKISIDGAKEKEYEYIRQGARFSHLLRNLERLSRARQERRCSAPLSMAVCVMKSNYHQLADFIDLAAAFGFSQVSFGLIHGELAPEEKIDLCRDHEVLGVLKSQYSLLLEKATTSGIQVEIIFEHMLHADTDLDENRLYKGTRGGSSQERVCRRPWESLCVDAIRGGLIFPDCLCSEGAGHAPAQDLWSVWNGPGMQEYRRALGNKRSERVCSKHCLNGYTPAAYMG